MRYIIAYFVAIVAISIFLGWPLLTPVGLGLPLLFALYVATNGDVCVNAQKNQQFPENLDIRNREHDAFVIIHSLGSSIGSYVGLDILIPHYIRNRFPFKIYHCYNPQEFLDVLKNDKAKYLWIIGHGWRGGITFKWTTSFRGFLYHKQNRTLFPYAKIRENLDQYPKKAFIAQFHCNHIDKTYAQNESLVEILLDTFEESHYYITEDLSNVVSTWFATRELKSRIQRTSVSEAEIQQGVEPDSGGCSWIQLI